MPSHKTLRLIGALVLPAQLSCLFFHGQRYRDFSVATPLPARQHLVLGFLGGRESWDDPDQGVRQLALKLRGMKIDAAVETVENKKRDLALRLIADCFDRDRDGRLDDREKGRVRLILYGQSFGAAAVVKLARQLQARQIPVLLTVQIDSVGRGDAVIPPNVASAANLFQNNGLLIKGESEIRAEDPERTRILGNFRFDYSKKKIDLSGVNWFKRLFRVAHTKMGQDPEVWQLVERLILEALGPAQK